MKLVTLNAWGGRVKDSLATFLDVKKDIDIWCFQEVYREGYHAEDGIDRSKANFNLYGDLQKQLPAFTHEFCPVINNKYGVATFYRSTLKIFEKGEMLVAVGNWHDLSDLQNRDHHRKLLWIEMNLNGKKLLIANTHLSHRPEGKKDSEKRLQQSVMIVNFLKMFDCPKILCGDFNLLPDTESIKIIEDAGMRNLIKEYKVESTRTELYKKPLRFADYIFVSPEIKVNDFQVLPDVVSDHSPLYLDFQI